MLLPGTWTLRRMWVTISTNSVQDALDRICMQPLAYPVAIRDVRSIRLEHFPYRLYYRVVDQSVVVHVIFHLSRDPEKLRRYLGRI
jgi:hypothetical protein